jgi:ribosomal protein L40E
LVLNDADQDDQIACPQCRTINEMSSKYCSKCGALLKVSCPFCYAANPIGAVYCERCGANLQKAAQRRNDWLTEKRKHDAERVAAWEQAEAESREAAMHRLLKSLDEPANHAFAIYCLREYGTHAVEPLINVLRTDADPDARFGAAHTLGIIGDAAAIPALIDALSDPEPAVRYWAVDALGKLGAEAAVKAIGKLLKDRHQGVRAHAAEALRRIGTPQAKRALEREKRWWHFN